MTSRYTFRHVARMEWIKLRTLRSVRWTLLFALAGMIGIGIAAGFNLSPWAGLAIIGAYAVALLAVGGWLLARRDA